MMDKHIFKFKRMQIGLEILAQPEIDSLVANSLKNGFQFCYSQILRINSSLVLGPRAALAHKDLLIVDASGKFH